MKLPTFKVKQGIIHVNSINLDHCSEDALVFSIDTKQKYTQLYLDGTGRGFEIGLTEETLGVDDYNLDNTEIKFEGWHVGDLNLLNSLTLTTGGRYGFHISIVKVKTIAQFIDDDNFTDGSL